MAGIAHKNLTDPQLHEPKGASSATLNEILFAKGDGTTAWEPITIYKMAYTPGVVQKAATPTLTPVVDIDYAGMSAITDGSVSDAINFTNTNKNVKELAVSLTTTNSYITELQTALKSHVQVINKLITVLQEAGLIQIGD